MSETVHYRTCTLCDAQCRLRIAVRADGTVQTRGLDNDPWSRGHICAKGARIADLHFDPDRLKQPLVRRNGRLQPADWETALSEATERLVDLRKRYGQHSVGLYFGNPNVHHYDNLLAAALFTTFLQTRALFSARSVDNLPHAWASQHMFGDAMMIPVPDVDRATLLVVWGANPKVSNGGGMSSGDVHARMRGVQERGGRVMVLDPRRTETADAADEYLSIRPGSDAWLLLALIRELFQQGWVRSGRWRAWTRNVEALEQLALPYAPERVAPVVGLSAASIRQLARALATADRPCIYARLGVCTQAHGGVAAWLVVALTTLLDGLDEPGGLGFPTPAVDLREWMCWLGQRSDWSAGATAKADFPALTRELPVVAIPDEVAATGPHRLRGLVSVAGNLLRSAPDTRTMAAALDQLHMRVSLDLYCNETSAGADVVLPVSGPLEREHYPMGLALISTRNLVSWSAPVFSPEPDGPRTDWDVLTDLGLRIARAEGRTGWAALLRWVRWLGPRRILGAMVALGPHGKLRGGSVGLSSVMQHKTTIDLGSLQSRLPRILGTPDRLVDLAPPELRAGIERLDPLTIAPTDTHPLILLTRRTTRSVNSWLHNLPRLQAGRPRFVLEISPPDAAARGIQTDALVWVEARSGRLQSTARVTERVCPGVVTLPHGWGHTVDSSRLSVAKQSPGANYNLLTSRSAADPSTGTACYAVPCEVRAAAHERSVLTAD